MRRLVLWLGILWVLGTLVFVGVRVYERLAASPATEADLRTTAGATQSKIVAALEDALRTGDETREIIVTARKRESDETTEAGKGQAVEIAREESAPPPPPAGEPAPPPAAEPAPGLQGSLDDASLAMRNAQERAQLDLQKQQKQDEAERAWRDGETQAYEKNQEREAAREPSASGMAGGGGGGSLEIGRQDYAPSAPQTMAPPAPLPDVKPSPPPAKPPKDGYVGAPQSETTYGNSGIAVAPTAVLDALKKANELHRVTVFYGTDRTLVKGDGKLAYSALPSGKLDFGSVEVTLPPKHVRGQLERPQWWRFEFTPDEQKHVVFQGFTRLKEDKFFTSLKALVAKSPHKQAFVFIHGFDTSFEDAAMRTAQLDHDLNFDGAPIFYSWSSRGELNLLAYAADETTVDQTVPQLADFLQMVATRTGAERIHVIAHSMGNRALVNALAQLDTRGQNHKPFRQIVLAAPDIDRVVFQRLAKEIPGKAENVTLYASSHDQALQASLKFHGFPRAGDATGGVVIVPGITSIDASAVATELFSFGHSFFADSRSVLDDIRALFDAGSLPATRGLHPVKIGDQVYWRID